MKKLSILIACEYSGIVREAFAKKLGWNAFVASCDLLPTEKKWTSSPNQYHFETDVRKILHMEWDLIIAHPECTYITNSGVRWLYINGERNEERWEKLADGCDFFNLFLDHPCPRICIENPIPHKHAKAMLHGEYTQLIQPYQFGHTTSKATCLWLKGLPKLTPTQLIPKEERTFEIHKAAPGPDRWKLRSKTFQGIADAMADQWSKVLLDDKA